MGEAAGAPEAPEDLKDLVEEIEAGIKRDKGLRPRLSRQDREARVERRDTLDQAELAAWSERVAAQNQQEATNIAESIKSGPEEQSAIEDAKVDPKQRTQHEVQVERRDAEVVKQPTQQQSEKTAQQIHEGQVLAQPQKKENPVWSTVKSVLGFIAMLFLMSRASGGRSRQTFTSNLPQDPRHQ